MEFVHVISPYLDSLYDFRVGFRTFAGSGTIWCILEIQEIFGS